METLDATGSSNITGGTYDPETRTLTLSFASGGTYVYTGVPPDVWKGLKEAGSTGAYFWRHIRGRYMDESV